MTWPAELAGLIGSPPALVQVGLDGKVSTGARTADGSQVRLVAALVGPDAVALVIAAMVAVGAKTSEVPVAAVVLGGINLVRQGDDRRRPPHSEGHRPPHP